MSDRTHSSFNRRGTHSARFSGVGIIRWPSVDSLCQVLRGGDHTVAVGGLTLPGSPGWGSYGGRRWTHSARFSGVGIIRWPSVDSLCQVLRSGDHTVAVGGLTLPGSPGWGSYGGRRWTHSARFSRVGIIRWPSVDSLCQVLRGGDHTVAVGGLTLPGSPGWGSYGGRQWTHSARFSGVGIIRWPSVDSLCQVLRGGDHTVAVGGLTLPGSPGWGSYGGRRWTHSARFSGVGIIRWPSVDSLCQVLRGGDHTVAVGGLTLSGSPG